MTLFVIYVLPSAIEDRQ